MHIFVHVPYANVTVLNNILLATFVTPLWWLFIIFNKIDWLIDWWLIAVIWCQWLLLTGLNQWKWSSLLWQSLSSHDWGFNVVFQTRVLLSRHKVLSRAETLSEAKESCFTKTVPIVPSIRLSFLKCFESGQICQNAQKLFEKCTFLESCSKSKKLLKSCRAESVLGLPIGMLRTV